MRAPGVSVDARQGQRSAGAVEQQAAGARNDVGDRRIPARDEFEISSGNIDAARHLRCYAGQAYNIRTAREIHGKAVAGRARAYTTRNAAGCTHRNCQAGAFDADPARAAEGDIRTPTPASVTAGHGSINGDRTAALKHDACATRTAEGVAAIGTKTIAAISAHAAGHIGTDYAMAFRTEKDAHAANAAGTSDAAAGAAAIAAIAAQAPGYRPAVGQLTIVDSNAGTARATDAAIAADAGTAGATGVALDHAVVDQDAGPENDTDATQAAVAATIGAGAGAGGGTGTDDVVIGQRAGAENDAIAAISAVAADDASGANAPDLAVDRAVIDQVAGTQPDAVSANAAIPSVAASACGTAPSGNTALHETVDNLE
ncbi:MAG: hypothetical protein ACTHNH_20870 [Mesorhizobium sp.]